MQIPRLLMTVAIVLSSGVFVEQASAQLYLNQVQAPRAQPSVAAPAARRAPTFNLQPISKPFKNVQQRPTVSPYLNLVRDDNGAAANYQTLVRPQMEQIDFNRQQQTRLDRLDRQFQSFRNENAYPIQGSEQLRETGHSTRFMNRSHFYPN